MGTVIQCSKPCVHKASEVDMCIRKVVSLHDGECLHFKVDPKSVSATPDEKIDLQTENI